MNLHVVSVEYSLDRPDTSLGDAPLSPLFHRVSACCPIIHIFGYTFLVKESKKASPRTATSAGVSQCSPMPGDVHQYTVCAHIHGVHPYFYVLCNDTRVSAVQFGTQLEAVANAKLDAREKCPNDASSKFGQAEQIIHHVELVWLLPFYGFHHSKRPFYKVYVINPALIPPLQRLLCSTMHMCGKSWLVHEAHSPFHFQFMVDYGLKGMAPFIIPACTARAPLPEGVGRQIAHFTSFTPDGRPPRLSCAQIEVDVTAACMQQRSRTMEPGENLLTVQRRVRQYFAEAGADESALRKCIADLQPRQFCVKDQQQYDFAVPAMRRRVLESLEIRGVVPLVEKVPLSARSDSTLQLMHDMRGSGAANATLTTLALSETPVSEHATLPTADNAPASPSVGCCGGGASSLHGAEVHSKDEDNVKDVTKKEGEEECSTLRGEVTDMEDVCEQPGAGSLGQARFVASDASANVDVVVEEKQEFSLFSTQAESDELFLSACSADGTRSAGVSGSQMCSQHVVSDQQCSTSVLGVGKSVVISNASIDALSGPRVLFAQITAMDNRNVRFRWYLTLQETHLADCQQELEKTKRWLAMQTADDGATQELLPLLTGEVLLGDIEDENPVDILHYCSPVTVHHSYRDIKNTSAEGGTLLCRYNYHISEQRMTTIDPSGAGEHVTLPLPLSEGTAPSRKLRGSVPVAEVEDEDDELFSSGSSTSSLLANKPFYPEASMKTPQRGVCDKDSDSQFLYGKPQPSVQYSVPKVMREVAESQLSFLQSFSLTNTAPSNPQQSAAPSEVIISSGGTKPSCSLTVSSVECLNPKHETLLEEIKKKGYHLQVFDIVGDIPRNFRWTYDTNKNCVVVSAFSWPESVPQIPTSIANKTTPDSAAARMSVPMLTHVAASQEFTPPVQKRAVDRERRSYTFVSSRGSRSQGGTSHVTCALRVVFVEVLIHRRPGVQHVVQEEIMAVALGQATSDKEKVNVQIFCVVHESFAAPSLLQGDSHAFSGAVELVYLQTEKQMLRRVVQELRAYDPDVIVSWEGGRRGVGLFALRYRVVLGASFSIDLSRLTTGVASLEDDTNAVCVQGAGKDVKSEDIDSHKKDDPRDPSELNTNREVVSSPSSCVSTSSTDSVDSKPARDDGDQILVTDQVPSATRGGKAAAQHLTVEMLAKKFSKRFGGDPQIPGRVVVDLSRQLRKTLALPSYSLQMVYQQFFDKSLPYFTDVALTKMFRNRDPGMRHVALSTLVTRVVVSHRVTQHLRFFTRTAEYARMYGILFEEVLTRGSQYRVEATLHRIAKPMGFAMLSPPIEFVHKQPRMQSMALIMQPLSNFYKDDPVVVLDFRSLYPSIVIAYNICYSTCLGSIRLHGRGRLGVLNSYRQADSLLLSLLSDDGRNVNSDKGAVSADNSHKVTFTPNGCMFLTPDTREGIMPIMLRALLKTRFEIQEALKQVAVPQNDDYMQQVFQEQQEAIKLLANTTYGYSAASVTGRMPCVEVADAIVMLGRQTLERAMRFINAHPTWNAEVVYGDTDSIFVRLPGRTKEEAFSLGEEIAMEVTAINPAPVMLRVEKVLFPCLLLVRKRYVGYCYSKPDQQEPEFMAKGIETVRRDQCPATARLSQHMIHLLFSGASAEEMRKSFFEEVGKIQRGDCNPADCIFRKAVRLGSYKGVTYMPASAHLALRLMEEDVLRAPYWGERVPFVVVHDTSATRLFERVIHPERLLDSAESFRLDSEYYIKRHVVRALDRMLSVVGLSSERWYAEMPRRCTYRNYFDTGVVLGAKRARDQQNRPGTVVEPQGNRQDSGKKRHSRNKSRSAIVRNKPRAVERTLESYYPQRRCAVCLRMISRVIVRSLPVCDECQTDCQGSLMRVVARRCGVEHRMRLLEVPYQLAGSVYPQKGIAVQSGQTEYDEDLRCMSIDCHLSFEKRHLSNIYSQLVALEAHLTS
uniref:DNA polymerase n=1 Tax=Trypanosoma vivax (strain Y486) TaxID=1055687 RepID=G0U0R6_TRYVY|nr:putative DNA polymerase zeta catalytic subunit, fragment [Trypanosoma vivax Y486]